MDKNTPFEKMFESYIKINESIRKQTGKNISFGNVKQSSRGKIEELVDVPIKRIEVYKTIQKYLKEDDYANICLELDKKYPKGLWKDCFPKVHILTTLINNYIEYF